ncbi:MAG: PTS sugar transporter subunit IIA [Deltaproteobacteria bacterium]|nr:PTS sugar transporter subunit IIA [Deltaproteobacteria bacterium]
MIGVLVIAHSNLAGELVSAAELIVGKMERVVGVPVTPHQSVEQLRNQIAQAIKVVNKGDGVVILTDMFGGTPSNISLSFLEQDKVEVVTGVNLPMVVRVATYQGDQKNLKELAQHIMGYGRDNIYLASELLQQKDKKR